MKECNAYLLTIIHFTSLNVTNTGRLTFNETCCKEKGIPLDCMGVCKFDTTLKSAAPDAPKYWSGVLPPRKCDKWQNIAKECLIEGEANLKIDYVLIF